ncbi:hypothetical protein ACWEOZ_32805 [Actinoplanes sp. NPDC004185]
MSERVDRAALAGAAVAGIISISSAEGRYEPLDAVMGVVLGILLVTFYRPERPALRRDAWRPAASAAAVLALVLLIIVSPFIDNHAESLTKELKDQQAAAKLSVEVSRQLSEIWLGAFAVTFIILWVTRMKPFAKTLSDIPRTPYIDGQAESLTKDSTNQQAAAQRAIPGQHSDGLWLGALAMLIVLWIRRTKPNVTESSSGPRATTPWPPGNQHHLSTTPDG